MWGTKDRELFSCETEMSNRNSTTSMDLAEFGAADSDAGRLVYVRRAMLGAFPMAEAQG